MKIHNPIDESSLSDSYVTSALIASAITRASELTLEEFSPPPATTEEVATSGASFIIPLMIPEAMLSGDNRMIEEDALTNRDLPLPLRWQIASNKSGHDGSVIVARIDSIERLPNGYGNARGVFDVGPYGREAERMVRGGFLRGVSADLDQFEAFSDDSDDDSSAENIIKTDKISISSARVSGATLVAIPAYQECFIMIDENTNPIEGMDNSTPDGEYEESLLEDYDAQMAALAASAAPIVPPKNWFANPELFEPTPLTIDDDGRVYGHIAAWHVDHIGLPRATKPPRSKSKYAYFRTGNLRVDDGSDVQVGQLTLAGGHASLHASASDAVKHYDDTASAIADVIAGEDAHGIWVAGALRPEATPIQVRALRASAPSGDWRPINGTLELVAVCQVNVPGFPLARSIVAGGQIQALVAAGASPLAEIRETKRMSGIEKRLHELERKEMESARDMAIMDLTQFALQASAARSEEEPKEDLKAVAASAMADLESFKTQAEFQAALADLKTMLDS